VIEAEMNKTKTKKDNFLPMVAGCCKELQISGNSAEKRKFQYGAGWLNSCPVYI
jgi:hypothetical protein